MCNLDFRLEFRSRLNKILGSTGGSLGSGNTGGNGDAVLLEDVNDLTELWYLKTRGVWPIKYVTTLFCPCSKAFVTILRLV